MCAEKTTWTSKSCLQSKQRGEESQEIVHVTKWQNIDTTNTGLMEGGTAITHYSDWWRCGRSTIVSPCSLGRHNSRSTHSEDIYALA